jgi:hypothetical protein
MRIQIIAAQAGAKTRGFLARPRQSNPPMQSQPLVSGAFEFCPREREVGGRCASSLSHGHTRCAAPIPSPADRQQPRQLRQ